MMRKQRIGIISAILVVGVGAIVAVATAGVEQAKPTVQGSVSTVKVERGTLSSMVSESGTLAFRARPDGSPYSVINQADGTYTQLPGSGDKINCGDVFYRVDDKSVLLLCGPVPVYRDLRVGVTGNDVRQLNASLQRLGYEADADAAVFNSNTQNALKKFQQDKSLDITGTLEMDDVVFLPASVRIFTVTGKLGGKAQPGTPVLDATSDSPEVQVELPPAQQGVVNVGDQVQITLPNNKVVAGKVDRLATVAQIPAGPNGDAGAAFIPAYISLDNPEVAVGFDKATVRLEVATAGVENVLSVPVVALVGKTGGGFAVEVVRDGGRRELVEVEPGLYDSAAGRVQVDGEIQEGDEVVVPS